MAGKSVTLGALTMTDLIRLYEAQQCLEAIDDAIKATSVQGKPNFIELLRQAYERMDLVIAKGARRAVMLGAEGAWSRLNVTPEMIQKLAAMAAARRSSGEED